MEKYKVEINSKAHSDLESIVEYIAFTLDAGISAMKLYDRIVEEILDLEFFPARNRLVEVEPERSMGLRRMIVDNYSVFYKINGDVVTVTHILYNGSDILSRLRGEQ